jgi:hypothetical protein
MKQRKKHKELDVDSIGNQEPLTREEEQLISEFIKKRRTKLKAKERKKQNAD